MGVHLPVKCSAPSELRSWLHWCREQQQLLQAFLGVQEAGRNDSKSGHLVENAQQQHECSTGAAAAGHVSSRRKPCYC
jgi:hypothetical protein